MECCCTALLNASIFATHLAWRLIAVDIGAVAPLLKTLDALLVCIQFLVDIGICICAHDTSQGWVVHDSQIVEDLCSLRRIASLSTMALSHRLPSVHMIVCGVVDFAKVHRPTGPVGAEAAGFDASELYAPFGLHLFRNGFGEALDGPLACTIDAEIRYTCIC